MNSLAFLIRSMNPTPTMSYFTPKLIYSPKWITIFRATLTPDFNKNLFKSFVYFITKIDNF